MDDKRHVVQGTGWIVIPEFGQINPRRDNEDGGREFFDAKLENGEYALVAGTTITGGQETWFYELDKPFFLSYRDGGPCIEVTISLVMGGRYSVAYIPAAWPTASSLSAGGWT